MRIRPVRRSIATVTGVVALATVGALLVPTAAYANHQEIYTDSIEWESVDDETGTIDDASIYDFANDSYGWNDDAFDEFGFLTLNDTVQGTWDFADDDAIAVSAIAVGGTSVITMTGTTSDWAFPYTVVLTLTLEGNYAHWAYDISNPTNPDGLANSSVRFYGNLGSDSETVYQVNSGNTLVSHDSSDDGDPVIGYNVVTDGTFGGWTAVNGDDDPETDAAAASEFDVYLVLHGYTPCANGFDLAVAAVTALVPTLPATFGERYDDAGACITVTPLSLVRGVPVNQVLVYTIDPALTTPTDDWYSIVESYFIDELVSSVVDNLPAGLTAASAVQPDGSIVVTISGTPTTSGTFTSRLLFAQGSDNGFNQVLGNVAITVADPVVPPRPELAATGTDVLVPIGLGSLLLLTGLGMAVIARRRLA